MRLPFVDESPLPPDVRAALAAMPPQATVYRMLAHAQTAFLPMLRTVGAIQGTLALDPRLRQLAILRVAGRDDCEYERVQHEVISTIEGVPADQIAALRDGRASGAEFGPDDTLVLRFVDELLDHVGATEQTVAEMARRFAPREIVELITIVGSLPRHRDAAEDLRARAAASVGPGGDPRGPRPASSPVAMTPQPATYDGPVPDRPAKARRAEPRTSSLRDEQRAFTHQRLRDAALQVIEKTGYPGATIDEIAAAAGASRATSLHFKSKAELIRELVETMPDRQQVWDDLGAMRNPCRSRGTSVA